jgi:hypothetical protein
MPAANRTALLRIQANIDERQAIAEKLLKILLVGSVEDARTTGQIVDDRWYYSPLSFWRLFDVSSIALFLFACMLRMVANNL